MKRMHVHVGVENLERSISFYSALFATQPALVKSDYAKWMLDDPRVNFAISTAASRRAWTISASKWKTRASCTRSTRGCGKRAAL
jgi:hypothetical protein